MPYTIEQIGAQAKARNPETLGRFTDAEVGKRLVERNPELSKLVAPPLMAETTAPAGPTGLAAIGAGFREAAQAPTRAAVGALKFGQELAQKGLGALGVAVPQRGDSVMSDVLVHGGALGMEALNKSREQAGTAGKVGGTVGNVGLSIAAAGQYGGQPGKLAWEAVKQGSILPAFGYGALGGAESGLAGGFATSLEQGQKPSDVAKTTATSGLAGGVVGGVLSGTMAGAVKGYNALRPVTEKVAEKAGVLGERYAMSAEQKATQLAQKDELLYGADRATLSGRQTQAIKMADSTGVLPGDVSIVREAVPQERTLMKQMFDTAKGNFGKRAPDVRPVQIAGKEVVKYADKLDEFRAIAGADLEDAVNAMPDTPVDTTKAEGFFSKFLSDNGVKRTTDGMDFSRSRFKGNVKLQSEAESLLDDLARGDLTPKDVVNLRRRLFDMLGLAKDQKDIYGPLEGALGKTRELMDEPLAAASPEYSKAARDYAIARQSLKDWYKKIGMEFIEGRKPSGDLKAGEVMKRFLGNASADYYSLLDETDAAFAHFGYEPDVDVRNLLRWDAALEDIFGTTQTQSLRGQVGGGTKDAVNAILGGKSGMIRAGVGKVEEAVGMTREARIKALENLLMSFDEASGVGRSYGPGAASMNSPEFSPLGKTPPKFNDPAYANLDAKQTAQNASFFDDQAAQLAKDKAVLVPKAPPRR